MDPYLRNINRAIYSVVKQVPLFISVSFSFFVKISQQPNWPGACAAKRKSALSQADVMIEFVLTEAKRAVIRFNKALLPVTLSSHASNIITVLYHIIQYGIRAQGFDSG
jgi:hypothetical protein